MNPCRLSPRRPQWQPRATFISLRNKQPRSDVEQTRTETQPDPTANTLESTQRPSYNLFNGIGTQPSNQGGEQPQRVGRYSKHFSDEVEADPAAESLHAASQKAKTVEDEGKKYTWQIRKSLKDKGLQSAWVLFEKTYTSAECEALTNPSTADIREINEKRFFSFMLSQVIKDFCERQGEPAVTPTGALFKYEQLGIAPTSLWVKEAIEPLTYQVMLAANGSGAASQRDLPSLLFELISIWRLFFQCKGSGNAPLEAVSSEWNLPSIDALPQMWQSRDFNYRLQELHPKAIGSSTLGFCAIYMFNLSDAINSDESLRLQASPFLDVLVRVLSSSRVNSVLKHPAFSIAFQKLPQDVQAEITKEIEAAPGKALTAIGRGKGDASTTSSQSGSKPATADLESFNLRVIARAIESRASPVVLEGHWKRVVRDYTQNGKPTIPPRIYNAFLSGYLVLRQASRSVEVWNHMISNGVKPELPTWVAMLEGCVKAKDLEGFDGMWQRMLSAGVEPDNYAWTARVHGLMSFRRIDFGLRALDDMGKKWRSAENAVNAQPSNSKNAKGAKNTPVTAKLVNHCTKPSVEVVNGAMSGIVTLPDNARVSSAKRIEYVQKILQWGLQFGVKPDTRTFNILIQLYLNAGDYATAIKVLQQMEVSGVQADLSTHTMLMTASFDNGSLDNLSESDRANYLLKRIEAFEAEGLRLNNYVYASAIDRLLKHYGSYDAVRALIEHMQARNLSPSAHVYTSLLTYYFQQSPPAITAVDSLLQSIFASPHADTDKIFFDRTIEGYAAHGEVGKMMSVLTRMSRQGKHPSFQALTAVIRALVTAGDTDRARFIVRDVQRGEGIATGGVTGPYNDEKQFLYVAKNLGISVDEERMGDVFKMRKDVSMLDEKIEAHMQERNMVERQPDLQAREQGMGAQVVSDDATHLSSKSHTQDAPKQSDAGPEDLGPPEQDIHDFLSSNTDTDFRRR